MKIQLVADSSANMVTNHNLNVNYAPLKIDIGDNSYVDDKYLDTRAMVDHLKQHKGPSYTTCPNTHDWETAFADADMVLGVAISSGMSGSYNAGHLTAEQYMEENPGKKAFIIDSLSAASGSQLFIEKYQEYIDKGMSFEEIVKAIKEYRNHTHLLFSLTSLDTLAKNGRVSSIVAKAVGFLGIRIVGKASLKGELEPIHKCRGDKKAMLAIKEEMKKHGYNGGKARISHTFNPELANEWAATIKEEWPDADVTIVPNGGLCSYYGMEGSILIGYEGGERGLSVD